MSFGEAWKRAGEAPADWDPDDGGYVVAVVEGSAFAGRDGREWAKVILQVRDGEHTGREFTDFMNLNNEVGLRIAREKLVAYGIKADQIEDLEDLNAAMSELADTIATVTVGHKDGYLNVSVLTRRTGESDIPDGQETFDVGPRPAATAGARGAYDENDDDIPF